MEARKFQEGRPLGIQERLYYQLNRQGGLLLTNAYVITSREKHPLKVFVDVFESLCHLHPLLRMCVKRDASQQLVFMPIEDFKINLMVRESETSLCREMEKEMVTVFPEGGPMWRVIYLPCATPSYATATHPHQYPFLLSLAHVIADAGSVCVLMKNVFELLMKVNEVLEHDERKTVADQSTPLPIHAFADRYLGGKRKPVSSPAQLPPVPRPKVRPELLVNRNQWLNYRDENGLPQDLSNEPETGLINAHLSAEDTGALKAGLKKHQVTMTCFATAALSMAMHQLLPSESTEVLTQASRDLRILAARAGLTDTTVLEQVVPRSITLWARPINLEVSDDKSVWQLSRLCQEQLHGGDHLAEVFECLNRYGDASQSEEAANTLEPALSHGMTRGDLAIIYLGTPVPPSSEEPPFKVARLAASVSEHYLGRPVTLVLCTLDGSLQASLAYVTHVLCEKTAEKLLNRFLCIAKNV